MVRTLTGRRLEFWLSSKYHLSMERRIRRQGNIRNGSVAILAQAILAQVDVCFVFMQFQRRDTLLHSSCRSACWNRQSTKLWSRVTICQARRAPPCAPFQGRPKVGAPQWKEKAIGASKAPWCPLAGALLALQSPQLLFFSLHGGSSDVH